MTFCSPIGAVITIQEAENERKRKHRKKHLKMPDDKICPKCEMHGYLFDEIGYIGPKGGMHTVYFASCMTCGYVAPVGGKTKELALYAYVNDLQPIQGDEEELK